MFSGSVNRWGEFFPPCCNSYCLVLLKIRSRRDSLCGNVRKKKYFFMPCFFFFFLINVFLNRRSGFLDVRNQTMYCSPKIKHIYSPVSQLVICGQSIIWLQFLNIKLDSQNTILFVTLDLLYQSTIYVLATAPKLNQYWSISQSA